MSLLSLLVSAAFVDRRGEQIPVTLTLMSDTQSNIAGFRGLDDLAVSGADPHSSRARVDVVHLWEDMCGRQGPLISPRDWRAFMAPCYRRIHDFCVQSGIPILSVDTDGQPDLIVPPMMETVVNYLWPLEVAAGCDVNMYRERYPTLGLMGGIDKRALAEGKEAIDSELKRIRPAMEKGRYIPELDHGIPNDVSWQNYCYYAQRLGQLIGAIPLEGTVKSKMKTA